jgi:hypothetical protein
MSNWHDGKEKFYNVVTSLLAVAIIGLAFAYRQHKRSQEYVRKMLSDMEGLSKAEEALIDLQVSGLEAFLPLSLTLLVWVLDHLSLANLISLV